MLYLLENGAQVAEVDSGLMTALHWAVQFGHYNTLLTLLKVGSHIYYVSIGVGWGGVGVGVGWGRNTINRENQKELHLVCYQDERQAA